MEFETALDTTTQARDTTLQVQDTDSSNSTPFSHMQEKDRGRSSWTFPQEQADDVR